MESKIVIYTYIVIAYTPHSRFEFDSLESASCYLGSMGYDYPLVIDRRNY